MKKFNFPPWRTSLLIVTRHFIFTLYFISTKINCKIFLTAFVIDSVFTYLFTHFKWEKYLTNSEKTSLYFNDFYKLNVKY